LLFAFPAYPLPLSAYRVKFPGFFFLAYSFELSAFSFMLPTHASAPFIYSIQIPKNFYFIMHGLHEAFTISCFYLPVPSLLQTVKNPSGDNGNGSSSKSANGGR
jgi:hypothetical protein